MLFSIVDLTSAAFFLGLAHAFEADHMVAVSALVSESKGVRHSSLQGLLWGLGHTATLVAAGAVLLALKLVIPVPLMHFFESLVGVMLLIVGVGVIYRSLRSAPHMHSDSHHHHSHRHRRSLMVGMVHGLAGTGALMLLAVGSASSFMGGMLFIMTFGVGSIAGMLLASTAFGIPLHLVSSRFAFAERVIPTCAGICSILLGTSIIYGNVMIYL